MDAEAEGRREGAGGRRGRRVGGQVREGVYICCRGPGVRRGGERGERVKEVHKDETEYKGEPDPDVWSALGWGGRVEGAAVAAEDVDFVGGGRSCWWRIFCVDGCV